MLCELSYVGRYDEVLTNEFASENGLAEKLEKKTVKSFSNTNNGWDKLQNNKDAYQTSFLSVFKPMSPQNNQQWNAKRLRVSSYH